jgi:cobalt transporter subunit CbtA
MSFKSIIYSALIVGIISGVVYGLFQQLAVNPIIYAAEVFEVSETPPPTTTESTSTPTIIPTTTDGHSHDSDHSHEAWGPEDGLQRIASTLGSNILISMSFSMIMIAAMAIHNQKSSKPPVDWKSGILWGLGALLAVYVSPALLGIHPEVPGTLGASLPDRQIWWITCCIATLLGLAFVYYATKWLKLGGLALIIAPHIIGAPGPSSHSYANTDPAAIAALDQLTREFIMMTSIGMLIFFTLLGALSGLASARMRHA